MRYFPLLLLLFFVSSCTDLTFAPVEEIAPNILDNDGPQLFFAEEINFIPRGNFDRDVQIRFRHIYDELPANLQDNITGIFIGTPRTAVTGPLSRSTVFEQNYTVGDSLCYSFGFTGTTVAGGTSRSTRVCFTVE